MSPLKLLLVVTGMRAAAGAAAAQTGEGLAGRPPGVCLGIVTQAGGSRHRVFFKSPRQRCWAKPLENHLQFLGLTGRG